MPSMAGAAACSKRIQQERGTDKGARSWFICTGVCVAKDDHM
jgi:hypothetical protein